MTSLDEDVVQMPGQLPLPKMPSERSLFRLRPVRRPAGGTYRPRKPPAAMLLAAEDDEVSGVAVMRTHNVELAYRLAVRALEADDPRAEWELRAPALRWGSWRTDRSAEARTWVASVDGRRGTPAVFFDVEQR